jgi:hypothetical protein
LLVERVTRVEERLGANKLPRGKRVTWETRAYEREARRSCVRAAGPLPSCRQKLFAVWIN